jgi:hypothetical protein
VTEQQHYTRETPRSRKDGGSVSDFTMLVRTPGSPTRVRAFTEDERPGAEEYAAANGGTIVSLPLALPPGYTADPDGSLRA